VVTIEVKRAKTVGEKIKGLLGSPRPFNLQLNTRWGIHTFGMQFPIDILILDGTNTVQKLKQSLTPNRIFFWNPLWNTVVELPEGTIKEKQITIGTTLSIVYR